MTRFSDLLEIVKAGLESELSPTAYSLWIAPLKPIKIKDSEIVLALNNDFQKDIVMTKYSEKLCKSFKEVLGFDVRLKILVEENESQDVTPAKEEKKEPEEKIVSLDEFKDYPYTFKTFIVGSTNTFAYAACKAVAQNQTGAYNPLFIYGPSGLGKTHLLLAMN